MDRYTRSNLIILILLAIIAAIVALVVSQAGAREVDLEMHCQDSELCEVRLLPDSGLPDDLCPEASCDCPKLVPGDMNGDGVLSLVDLFWLRRALRDQQ